MRESCVERRLPKISWALDRYGMASSGAGTIESATKGAIGEFFERRHFNNEVFSIAKYYLRDSLSVEDVGAFLKAFRQTARKIPDAIEETRLNMVSALRLSDLQPVYVPTVCVSLNDISLGDDSEFLPRRDTTGCSAHFYLDKSMRSSVFELCERQYLLKHWITGGAESRVLDNKIFELEGAARFLFERLCGIGQVSMLDLTPAGEVGSTILCIFRGSNNAAVQYCVGLSLSGNPNRAATKAIYELWQSYNFLYTVTQQKVAKESIEDGYHRYFIECNRGEIADCMREANSCGEPQCNIEDDFLYEKIVTRYPDIFLYIGASSVMGRTIYFTKAFSPRFFLHINNAQNFNLENDFSSSWMHLNDSERVNTMVPFP
jgi:ribosomal protein S12 methylthiotransferase accessory factor YcaO